MLSSDNVEEIVDIINNSLDLAEKTWSLFGDKIEKTAALSHKAFVAEAVRTEIPGHRQIEIEAPEYGEFIAIVVDLRKSTEHLMCAISPSRSDVSGPQRLFYEVSSLLPALAKVVYLNSGRVTEYLGDGLLALIKVDDPPDEAIYKAHDIAMQSLDVLAQLVNPILKKRYRLEPLKIGIGLGMGPALVTAVGTGPYYQGKVFGECVFRATKLSKEIAEARIDKQLYFAWPVAEKGTVFFENRNIGNIHGYLLNGKRQTLVQQKSIYNEQRLSYL